MLKRIFHWLLERLDRALLPLATATRSMASVYYLLFNRRFGREQQSVVAGRLAYQRGLGAPAASKPLLLSAEAPGTLDVTEFRWARGVLVEYFKAVTDTPRIAAARKRFLTSSGSTEGSPGGRCDAAWSPQPHERGLRSGVDFDSFLLLCRQRRSVRWFDQRPVPRELVLQAIQAAAQAPSACNRQPFVFRYFEQTGDAQRVGGLAMGTTGYANQIPALVVVLGDLSCFPHERDRHVIYIDASLAAMQFMLALETLGLASCPINWPDVESLERRMQRELGLPRHLRPVMLIALGYPDPEGGIPASVKKPPESLLRLDDDYSA
jgi:nitroreductase